MFGIFCDIFGITVARSFIHLNQTLMTKIVRKSIFFLQVTIPTISDVISLIHNLTDNFLSYSFLFFAQSTSTDTML